MEFRVDEDYVENLDLQMVAGKFFDKTSIESNKGFVVLNEVGVKEIQLRNAG